MILVAGILWWMSSRRSSPVSETETLARAIRSEIGTGTDKQKLHVAWAVRNLARERKQSLAEMACSPCGMQGKKRPISTAQEALDADLALAEKVLKAPRKADPTGGATHFINPKLQDRLAKRGRRGYRGRPYRKVRRRWIREYKWSPYYRIGTDLEMWGPRRNKKK